MHLSKPTKDTWENLTGSNSAHQAQSPITSSSNLGQFTGLGRIWDACVESLINVFFNKMKNNLIGPTATVGVGMGV